MSRLTRDGTAKLISRDQILRHARGQRNIIFPVQLTTSRIGNLTRLIHTLLYVMTIHTYIHTVDPMLLPSGNPFIGTQLRDPINSGLTRWRMAVIMDAAAQLGRNPVSRYQIQPEYYGDEQTGAGRDCRARLARLNSQARTTRTGKNYSFSVFSWDNEEDWQPYPVDPYSFIMWDHTL